MNINKNYYNLTQTSEILGFSRPTIMEMAVSGVLVKTSVNHYDKACVDALAEQVRNSYTFKQVYDLTQLSQKRISELHLSGKLRKILKSRYVKEDVDALVADLNERRKKL